MERGQEIEEVLIERLRFGLSPREEFCDAQHVAALAEVVDQVPPIVVQAGTLRVIDGVHRVHAALAVGRVRIRAVLFDGDEADAEVEAVRSNVAHGKPLSLAEREAAAVRILTLVAEWSDRRIASVTGLSPKTVGRLRRRASEESAQSRVRVGRDGRLRPVDPAEVRRRVGGALRADPTASNRAIATRTGASQATVRDVRERLARGESEVLGWQSEPEPGGAAVLTLSSTPPPPAAQAERAEVSGTAESAGLDGFGTIGGPAAELAGVPAPGVTREAETPTSDVADAAEASPPPDVVLEDFPAWFEARQIKDEQWRPFVATLPISRVYEVADACRRYSSSWRAFATALEDRARAHRRSPTSEFSGGKEDAD